MRTGISFKVSSEDRSRREAVISHPSSPQKHVWRCRIVLLSADGAGTMSIMAATGKFKTCVRRWQERFMAEGVDGLLREKRRGPTMTHDYKRNGTTTLFAALNVLDGSVIHCRQAM